MKNLLVASALAALAAGCATEGNVQVAQAAQAECKVAPLTIASATGGRPKAVSSLDQRYAEMQLASSDYRMRQLAERGMVNNNIEDALRSCPP